MTQDAERLRTYIERTVAAAPPLTPEQRDRLALLLRPVKPLTPAPLDEADPIDPVGGSALDEMLRN